MNFHARASAVAMSHSSTLACMERRSNCFSLFVTHVVSETCLIRFSLCLLLFFPKSCFPCLPGFCLICQLFGVVLNSSNATAVPCPSGSTLLNTTLRNTKVACIRGFQLKCESFVHCEIDSGKNPSIVILIPREISTTLPSPHRSVRTAVGP